MVGYGMAGVAAGGAIGKLASTFGVPKLADGGIVNTPTLALIGEKGPEAVIPLAEGAGANTLTAAQNKTNKLLAAILGSSEKQVNRLGDIGTS
jgi:phage-related minor tail protein